MRNKHNAALVSNARELRKNMTKEERHQDDTRTDFLTGYGLEVIRIPNNAVNQNFRGVCEYIDHILCQRLNTTDRHTQPTTTDPGKE